MNTYDIKQNIPWIEKYRPSHFHNIVLDHMNRTLFQNIIQFGHFPNLLFYGSPGTGKTTTIMNLIYEYQTHYERNRNGGISENTSTHSTGKLNINTIHLNASDERGIDVIRYQINQFVRTKNMFEEGVKFVILDEVDYMTKSAQQSLKVLIQTCIYNVRFCLICNYISKIDETLQNEFLCVRFNQLPKEEIRNFLRNISEKENMQLLDSQIETIQQLYNSDIRSMINFMQLNHEFKLGKDKHILNIISNVVWEKMYDMLSADTDSSSIIKYIHEISIQYNIDKRSILISYFNYIINNKLEFITVEYLKVVENIIHIHDDIPMEIILMYFCNTITELTKKNTNSISDTAFTSV